MPYDIRIWEEIRDRATWKKKKLSEDIQREIGSDRSLQEFQGSDPIPWQLRQVMQQRAESWIQRLYDSCCDAFKALGKETSVAFDMAVWAYCIEPFIMREQLNDHGYRASELLELLLLAVGSPPERRRLLRVSQKDACVAVRGRIWEIWHDQLLHLPPRGHQAAAVMARFNAMQREARLVAGLPPEQVKAPQPPPLPLVTPPEEQAKPSALQRTPVQYFKNATTSEPTLPEPSVRDAVEKVVEQQATAASPVAEGKWEDIEISFISDERVQIHHGKKLETLNYAEFGFEDGRSELPNQAWVLLRRLAERSGSIANEKEAGMAWPKVERRIQEIRAVFREHFGIASDPIPFLEKRQVQDRGGYNTRFKISCGRSYRT